MYIINFTPIPAFLGGSLIGLAVAFFFVFNGRLIGVSGIASNFLTSKDNRFDNFLFLVGPNTGLSHTSIIHVMESQYNYALDYLKNLKNKPNSYLNLKESVFKNFNKKILFFINLF